MRRLFFNFEFFADSFSDFPKIFEDRLQRCPCNGKSLAVTGLDRVILCHRDNGPECLQFLNCFFQLLQTVLNINVHRAVFLSQDNVILAPVEALENALEELNTKVAILVIFAQKKCVMGTIPMTPMTHS